MIGACDFGDLALPGRHTSVQHHMIDAGKRWQIAAVCWPGEREAMSGLVGCVDESIAQKFAEWRVIVGGVEVAHENIAGVRVTAHQAKFVKRTFPLSPVSGHGCGGVHGDETNLVASHVHCAGGHE